jgi:hypothetical protein
MQSAVTVVFVVNFTPPGAGLNVLRRCLPAELAAATRLTSLVLRDPGHIQLDVPTSALPGSLQHLRLTNSIDPDDTLDSVYALELMTRDLRCMKRLQGLQLAVHDWAEHWLPLG